MIGFLRNLLRLIRARKLNEKGRKRTTVVSVEHEIDDWGLTPTRDSTGSEFSNKAMVFSYSSCHQSYKLRLSRGSSQMSSTRFEGQTLAESTNKLPAEVIKEMVDRYFDSSREIKDDIDDTIIDCDASSSNLSQCDTCTTLSDEDCLTNNAATDDYSDLNIRRMTIDEFEILDSVCSEIDTPEEIVDSPVAEDIFDTSVTLPEHEEIEVPSSSSSVSSARTSVESLDLSTVTTSSSSSSVGQCTHHNCHINVEKDMSGGIVITINAQELANISNNGNQVIRIQILTSNECQDSKSSRSPRSSRESKRSSRRSSSSKSKKNDDKDSKSRCRISRKSSRRSEDSNIQGMEGLEDLLYNMRNSNIIYAPAE